MFNRHFKISSFKKINILSSIDWLGNFIGFLPFIKLEQNKLGQKVSAKLPFFKSKFVRSKLQSRLRKGDSYLTRRNNKIRTNLLTKLKLNRSQSNWSWKNGQENGALVVMTHLWLEMKHLCRQFDCLNAERAYRWSESRFGESVSSWI